MSAVEACILCATEGGIPILRRPAWRLVRVEDTPGFPAFYRVIWNAHVAEWSDLDAEARSDCLEVVTTVERVLRQKLAPTKINLASLGNVVPHLHWHVVARFEWDSHFPAPLWAAAVRPVHTRRHEELVASMPAVDEALRQALSDG